MTNLELLQKQVQDRQVACKHGSYQVDHLRVKGIILADVLLKCKNCGKMWAGVIQGVN